ncbi:Inositol 3-kinase-like protein [Drosera capensis]
MSTSSQIIVVGNPCHDTIFHNNTIVAESLGGAVSFINLALSSLSIDTHLISKAGLDFKYRETLDSPPLMILPESKTTRFEARFGGGDDRVLKRVSACENILENDVGSFDFGDGSDWVFRRVSACETILGNNRRNDFGVGSDRVLKRVSACEPIWGNDLPMMKHFGFGMAVGVGGELMPETIERMVEICRVVVVDVQGLIREFDGVDGKVGLVGLKESGFYHLMNRIGFLKASAEEEVCLDVEEVRKMCCVVITNGKNGCRVCWSDGEVNVGAFEAVEVDPTGAGDSFLGGFVGGLVMGLDVADAGLLGNFLGALTVEQVGLPKFDDKLMQRVKTEVQKRRLQYNGSNVEKEVGIRFLKSADHDQFRESLAAVKLPSASPQQEPRRDLSNLNNGAVVNGTNGNYVEQKLIANGTVDDSIESFSLIP